MFLLDHYKRGASALFISEFALLPCDAAASHIGLRGPDARRDQHDAAAEAVREGTERSAREQRAPPG